MDRPYFLSEKMPDKPSYRDETIHEKGIYDWLIDLIDEAKEGKYQSCNYAEQIIVEMLEPFADYNFDRGYWFAKRQTIGERIKNLFITTKEQS